MTEYVEIAVNGRRRLATRTTQTCNVVTTVVAKKTLMNDIEYSRTF